MAETPRPILANVTRLHYYMDHAGWAAVVVRSGKNFTYLAGFAYPGTLARHLDFPDSPREVLLLWPRHGEPVMVLNHYAAPLARRDSWLQRIEVYDDYAESPYERVAALLQQMGLHADTIGMGEDLRQCRTLGGDAAPPPRGQAGGLHRPDGAGALGENARGNAGAEGRRRSPG
jgi:Xaa-Pro aminopeptidase